MFAKVELNMIAAATNPKAEVDDADRMAWAIVEIMEQQEECLPHELLRKGFTYDEINRLWAKAKALAIFELRISKR